MTNIFQLFPKIFPNFFFANYVTKFVKTSRIGIKIVIKRGDLIKINIRVLTAGVLTAEFGVVSQKKTPKTVRTSKF